MCRPPPSKSWPRAERYCAPRLSFDGAAAPPIRTLALIDVVAELLALAPLPAERFDAFDVSCGEPAGAGAAPLREPPDVALRAVLRRRVFRRRVAILRPMLSAPRLCAERSDRCDPLGWLLAERTDVCSGDAGSGSNASTFVVELMLN